MDDDRWIIIELSKSISIQQQLCENIILAFRISVDSSIDFVVVKVQAIHDAVGALLDWIFLLEFVETLRIEGSHVWHIFGGVLNEDYFLANVLMHHSVWSLFHFHYEISTYFGGTKSTIASTVWGFFVGAVNDLSIGWLIITSIEGIPCIPLNFSSNSWDLQ